MTDGKEHTTNGAPRRRASGKLIAVALVAGLLIAGLLFAFAQRRPSGSRPRRADGSTAAGQVILRAGDDLQAALDAARPGDTITLEAGATFVGPFTLPVKRGEAFVTVQSAALARLPGENTRVTPAHAPLMPKIVAPGRNEPALRTAPGAHHFRFVGVEFKPADAKTVVSDLIQLGDGSSAQDTAAEIPHHLVFDRCYIHGDPQGALKRGVALNSAATDILNSHVSDAKGKGQDTQAVCGWNGPGPFRIVNNYLEGAGENVMFGGADPSVPNLVPSDIEILGNHFSKPLAWRGVWTVKNLFELKNARRVRIEGNLFENCWGDAQVGFAILFTVRNQGGTAPWSTIEDVQFTNNVVRHSGGGVNILGKDDLQPSQQAKGLSVVNNLFEDLDGGRWGGRGTFLQVTGASRVEVARNTVFQTNHVILAYGEPTTGFVFRDNIAPHNDYGVFGDAVGMGLAALARYFPGAVFSGNLLVAVPGHVTYPPRNFSPPTLQAIGFQDLSGRDYRLGPASPYKRRASDGRDPGCDMDALGRALKAPEGVYLP
ncbi:MAG TPA: hypothetical protein VGV38_19645 [Pyrinomonadaceae bacterium]|nr:hypothetical protein [Pyrinomonadaceae bacterium]